ncbi:hypothetical protein ACCC96_01855 [Pseudomonas sp. Pseusp11]|uniref:hypothetical protein n=1 Tax=Pseudomonas sp. Pseusp11 TaxID=3243003 RepID=UPI0039B6476C
MKNVLGDTSFFFKRTAWIKPPINQTILIYNSCDGYYLATWSGDEFISAMGSVLPDGLAELWHELPSEEELLNALNDRAFIELSLKTITETKLP